MLSIVVCEDNHEYRNFIADAALSAMTRREIAGSIVLQCASSAEVVSFLAGNAPNVYLLDIDLNTGLTGLDLAGLIHEKLPEAYIVFISQYANLVFKSFKVRPFDFLPKPVTQADLETVLVEINNDFQKRTEKEQPDFLPIKIGSQFYQIPKNEILFLEKFGNKCIIHSASKTVYCYQSLESISEKLDGDIFIRCHKSFIVNKTFIERIDLAEMEILLTNDQKCYIGGKYKKDLLAKISEASRP